MGLFKGVSVIESKAKRLLVAYEDFLESQPTKEAIAGNGEIFNLQLVALKSNVDHFRDHAQTIVSDPDFVTLSADLQDDIRNVAEASAAASDHIGKATHPDEVWKRADQTAKHDAVARHLASRDDRAIVGAHLRFDVIKQKSKK